jgi:hypothetical protein
MSARVQSLYVGAFVAALDRDYDASDGVEPERAAPGGMTAVRVPEPEAISSRTWAWVVVDDGAGGEITVTPGLVGSDVDGPYVDTAGPGPGEGVPLSAGWETLATPDPIWLAEFGAEDRTIVVEVEVP